MISYGAIVAREEEKRVRHTLSNGGDDTTAIPIRTITTAEAKITTVEVTIQTITLNKKQMTLSVFRQLQERNVIDPETYQLRGVPWGTVNYFWGGCLQEYHLHVVWQDGGKLFRSCTFHYSSAYRGLEAEERQIAADLAILRMREGWVPEKDRMRVYEHGLCDVTFERYSVDNGKRLNEMWHDAVNHFAGNIAGTDMSWFTKKYGRLMNAAEFRDTVLTTFARKKSADAGRWNASYQPLKDLDQLFIAV